MINRISYFKITDAPLYFKNLIDPQQFNNTWIIVHAQNHNPTSQLYETFHSHHDMIANQNEFRDEIRYTYKRKRVKSTHSDFIIVIIILGVL